MPESPFRRFLPPGEKKRRRLLRGKKPRHALPGNVYGVQRGFEALEDRSLLSATYLPINATGAANPSNMAALGGQVLFAADDGASGVELWKSDGTVSGTALVKDINPGATLVGTALTPNSSNPTDLVAVGGYVYFAANDGVDGAQLWRSDGTASGTSMITSGNASGGGTAPAELTDVGGKLFFTANDGTDGSQIWTTDGTTSGTTMVSNLQPSSGSANPSQLTAVGGSLFFTANAGDTGTQLYTTDGIATHTHLVFNVKNGSVGAAPTDPADVNGTLFYAGYDSVHGNQLWKSDGTAAGTTMVATIGSGTSSSNPTGLTAIGGTVYFSANDGVHGVELWKSDGTAQGTQLVADINATSAGASAYPADLTDVGGTLYFRADDGLHGAQLWRSDGTPAGTTQVATINAGGAGSTPDNLISANGYLFFSANDGTHGFELWQSDGTALGTTLLADINPGAPSSSPASLTAVGNNLLLAANDGTHGVSLYANAIPAARPTLQDNSYLFSAGSPLHIGAVGALSGATASPGTTLTAILLSPPAHGSLTLNSDGSFTYMPNAGYHGLDTFTINASDGSNTAVRPATVTLESLDYRWVASIYTDLLGRPSGGASAGEINYWVNQIASGMTRAQISDVFLHSNEYYAHVVNAYFQHFLHRDADMMASSYFVGELGLGASSDTVLAQILSSSEFVARSGSVNGLVSNLYTGLFGRLPTGGEFGYWVNRLNNGVTALDAAQVFIASSEYRRVVINALYEQYLDRPADAGATLFWLSQFQNGQPTQALEATLAASGEFYNG